PMLASTPASILNHKTAKNGIPSDSAKIGSALADIGEISRRTGHFFAVIGGRRSHSGSSLPHGQHHWPPRSMAASLSDKSYGRSDPKLSKEGQPAES
ncbi:hypothetical protein, partial [Rhizobium leguminosarum]|uniref:hypothetical protein n=1 Tax=Rhizobium leguminosarum TaxID=384 RepID=UPI001AEF106B